MKAGKSDGKVISPASDEVVSQIDDGVVRREVQNYLGVHLQAGPPPNAFVQKLEPSHITQVLDADEASNIRNHSTVRLLFLSGIVAFLVLCGMFLWAGQTGLLKEIVLVFSGLIAGALGGYGFGKSS